MRKGVIALALLAAVLAPAAAPAAGAARDLLGDPVPDPFIDLLRYRIEHRGFAAYPTVTDEGRFVEATTTTRHSIDEILDLYASEFERAGLDYEVKRVPGLSMAVFRGSIDGERKTVTLIGEPGGATMVRIASQRERDAHRTHAPSLLERHPELARLGDRIDSRREHQFGGSTGAVILYESRGGPERVLDRARSRLLAAGWSEAASRGARNVPTFRKGTATVTLVATAGGDGTTLAARYTEGLTAAARAAPEPR